MSKTIKEFFNSFLLTLCFFILLGSVLSGCSKKKETDLVTFKLIGEVISIDKPAKRVTIAHEEIPNYMMAMTMPFKVKDTTLLANLAVGDSVQGTLAVSRTESWLETLFVIGKGETKEPSAEDILFHKLFKEGEPLPDFALTNQDGKHIRFSDYKGKALAFTFIYSRCPLPDFCIRMSNHFARLQKMLSKEKNLDGKWHLLTISFDPAYDTPAVLKKYGKNYGADFSTWDFATDSLSTITKLADGLDLTTQQDEGGLIAHNLRTVLLDQKGNLVKIIKGNEWAPDDVVNDVRKLINQ